MIYVTNLARDIWFLCFYFVYIQLQTCFQNKSEIVSILRVYGGTQQRKAIYTIKFFFHTRTGNGRVAVKFSQRHSSYLSFMNWFKCASQFVLMQSCYYSNTYSWTWKNWLAILRYTALISFWLSTTKAFSSCAASGGTELDWTIKILNGNYEPPRLSYTKQKLRPMNAIEAARLHFSFR